jgi:hypothetical protein
MNGPEHVQACLDSICGEVRGAGAVAVNRFAEEPADARERISDKIRHS